MKRDAMYGGFFSFLPRLKVFLLETVYPERAVCRACGRISEGGVLCRECESRLRSDGTLNAWDREELEELIARTTAVHISDPVYRYVVDLVQRTREHEMIELGVSPRGALALCRMAKAHAFVEGRTSWPWRT